MNKEKYFSENTKDPIFGKIVDFVELNNIKSILDVGCGGGYLIDLLKLHSPNLKIKGIDLDKRFINTNIVEGNVYNIPFKNNSFDLVIAKDLIEHCSDNIKAIKELRRVTSKVLFISAPGPFTEAAWGDYQHIRPYTKQSLKHIANDFKLKVVEIGSIKRFFVYQILAKLMMQPIDDIVVYSFMEKLK